MSLIDSTSNPQISANDRIVLLGSCFSDSMYDLMVADKLQVSSNPFGTIFHPLALFQLLERSLNGIDFVADDYFKFDGYWFCYEQHSSLAERTIEAAMKKSNDRLKELKKDLESADHLVLTFGSNWGYFIADKIAANCHQQPGSLFNKQLSDLSILKKEMANVLRLMKKVNPKLNLLLTVSPVRHLKDGVVENQWSKALLTVFCHEMTQQYEHVSYFPSYEFVMDELRDYRYFKADKMHLSVDAIDQVYGFVNDHLFSPELKEQLVVWSKLKKSLAHRSLRLYSASNLKFKLKLLAELNSYSSNYKVNCDKELRELKLEIELIQMELNSTS